MNRHWTVLGRGTACLLLVITLTACAGTQSPPAVTPSPAETNPAATATTQPTAQAEPTATAAAGIPGELAEPTWLLLFYGPLDRQSALPSFARLTAGFGADGWLTGLGGCNWYTSTVVIEGNAISVAHLDQTHMEGCPPEALEREEDFLTILQQAAEYTLDGDRLQILTGEEVLVFQAQATPPIWVEVDSPPVGAAIDPAQPVVVEGRGQGMFEGSVLIRILDAQSHVLAQQAVIMEGEGVGTGSPGTWQVSLSLQGEAGAPARIVAMSQSPADGSVVAIDVVEVMFK